MTDDEKRILEGREGPLKRRALELVAAYAGALGAEELCRVTRAHLYAGSHFYLQIQKLRHLGVDEVISRMHFCSEEPLVMDRIACFAQTDAGPMDPDAASQLGFSPEEQARNEAFLERYLGAGVHLVGTCTPYLSGFVPLMGEHYVSTESHAIILMNSLWGACANADGIEMAFCSAVSGYTPRWGNHVPEQRHATHRFLVRHNPTSVHDWDSLGYAIGRLAPPFCVPLLSGNFAKPEINHLKACFAAMAASSGVEMAHIEGHTPEAMTEAMATGNRKIETIEVGEKEVRASVGDFMRPGGKVGFVSLGCPHYSIDQIKSVVRSLGGRRVHPRVELQVWTSGPMKSVADRCGYTRELERSGVRLLCGSCPLLTGKYPADSGHGLLFDSAKQANYIRSKTPNPVYYAAQDECVEAAVSGTYRPG